MPNTLNLSGIITETTGDPLTVELDRGVTIEVIHPKRISAERIDKLRGLIDEWEHTRSDARKFNLSVSIPRLVMSEEDYETWLRHEPPMAAFTALLDAINDFYAGAGSLGEEPASDAS